MNTNVSLLEEDVSGQTHPQLFQREQVEEVKYPAVHQAATPFQEPLSALLGRLEPEDLKETIEHIFTDLARLLGYLGLIETDLRQDSTLAEALPKFLLVQGETRMLLDFIESHALHLEGIPDAVHEVLDGTSYAIRMELRNVFESELAGLDELHQTSLVRAKVEHAHGMLGNCFQQSTIALARVFDPTLDGSRLFNDFQVRLEQSLILYRDLWRLVQVVQRAEREIERYPTTSLMENLKDFRDGSMRYLMFKDWEAYERFIDEVVDSRDTVACAAVLNRLGCYLETLLGQVRMRAVLADCPLDFFHREI